MFEQVAKYFTVFLSSMIKFIGGPLSGTAFGLTWVETCIFTVLGMMTSVLIFSLLGAEVRSRLFNRRKKKRRLFTTRNRRIVRIWRRYGLTGVAFLTPLIFSPILGTIVASSFGEPWKRIFVYMFVSAVFWGVVFSLLVHQLGHLVL
jgi:membrane protein DedA with SNARE-associated domain